MNSQRGPELQAPGEGGDCVGGFDVGEGGDGAVFWDVGVQFWGLGRGFLLASFVGLGFLGWFLWLRGRGESSKGGE